MPNFIFHRYNNASGDGEMLISNLGKDAKMYLLENSNGYELTLSNYGAVWMGMKIPVRGFSKIDVVLGFDSFEGYEENKPYFGAIIGRYANRISNASFSLDGVDYLLDANEGRNTLHSGFHAYKSRRWKAVPIEAENAVEFILESPDGDQGFPGNALIRVKYRLTEDNAVEIYYNAEADKDTVFNLINHAYFNLNGGGSGDVLDQIVRIEASRYTPIDSEKIPTGKIRDVTNTPFDFRRPKPIGQDILKESDMLQLYGGEYDLNYLFNESKEEKLMAAAWSETTGIGLQVSSDRPAMQFYTAKGLNCSNGKSGANYGQFGAFCFETQNCPDAPNKPGFPSTVYKKGERYESKTRYAFSVWE